MDRTWPLSFGYMSVEIKNISGFQITLLHRRADYLFVKYTPLSDWEPIEDRTIHGDGDLPLQLAESGGLFDAKSVGANVLIPEEYLHTATVRMVFVGVVAVWGEPDRMIVFYHDITAADFLPEPTPFPSGRHVNELANERMQLTWLLGAPVHAGFGSRASRRAGRPRLIRHAADASR